MGITLALDLMGGDEGPRVAVPAAKQALNVFKDLNLLLFGIEDQVFPLLKSTGLIRMDRIEFRPALCAVRSDMSPLAAFKQGKNSSLWLTLEAVASGDAKGAVTGGATGPVAVLSDRIIGRIPGVQRAALMRVIPAPCRNGTVMLDLGANINCSVDMLVQFAVMGNVAAKVLLGETSPRVALLNIGSEHCKGPLELRSAANILAHKSSINYIGFIEGDDIFSGKADVIITGGFAGNVALKTAEGVYHVMADCFKQERSSMLMRVIRHFLKRKIGLLEPDLYNGSALLGLKSVVVKSHGNANLFAYTNAINQALKQADKQVPSIIATGLTSL